MGVKKSSQKLGDEFGDALFLVFDGDGDALCEDLIDNKLFLEEVD